MSKARTSEIGGRGRVRIGRPVYSPVRQPAPGSPTHPTSFIDQAVGAISGAGADVGKTIGGFVAGVLPRPGGSNVAGGPFPGGGNAITNALKNSKRR